MQHWRLADTRLGRHMTRGASSDRAVTPAKAAQLAAAALLALPSARASHHSQVPWDMQDATLVPHDSMPPPPTWFLKWLSPSSRTSSGCSSSAWASGAASPASTWPARSRSASPCSAMTPSVRCALAGSTQAFLRCGARWARQECTCRGGKYGGGLGMREGTAGAKCLGVAAGSKADRQQPVPQPAGRHTWPRAVTWTSPASAAMVGSTASRYLGVYCKQGAPPEG